jgi:hypothetical protein
VWFVLRQKSEKDLFDCDDGLIVSWYLMMF